MVTIGDVFSVIAALLGIAISAWALLMVFVLLFPGRVAAARSEFERSPWTCGLVGASIFVTLGIFALRLGAVPLPGPKLLALMIDLTLMAIATLGLGGLVTVLAERIRNLDSNQTPYSSMLRASWVVVAGALFPVLGWFLVGPAILICSLGAGVVSLARRSTVRSSVQ